ncbi:hypothetical protein QFZ66_002319 [Streptomyces sp. B4I13]|nr:hypothetical protein [Streptomyces sp. B4I13]
MRQGAGGVVARATGRVPGGAVRSRAAGSRPPLYSRPLPCTFAVAFLAATSTGSHTGLNGGA